MVSVFVNYDTLVQTVWRSFKILSLYANKAVCVCGCVCACGCVCVSVSVSVGVGVGVCVCVRV